MSYSLKSRTDAGLFVDTPGAPEHRAVRERFDRAAGHASLLGRNADEERLGAVLTHGADGEGIAISRSEVRALINRLQAVLG